VGVVDEAFASYRLDSIAWDDVNGHDHDDHEHDDGSDGDGGGGGPIALSAGWQSDMSLYDTIDDAFPSGYDWSMMEEDVDDVDDYVRVMERTCADATMLRPCRDALNALHRIAGGKPSIVDDSDCDSDERRQSSSSSSSSSESSTFSTLRR
jgi:hypothetical protein